MNTKPNSCLSGLGFSVVLRSIDVLTSASELRYQRSVRSLFCGVLLRLSACSSCSAASLRAASIAEQHVMEDMGFLPTPEWWLRNMTMTAEMNRVPTKAKDVETSPIEQLQRTLAVELYKGEG